VHAANEAVYHGNGSWAPQPYSGHFGLGISVEEVALRIPGYLSAHKATGNPIFLQRAVEAGEYLLRERVFGDGHLLLQAHLVVDFCYSLVGTALLALWENDRSRTDFFEAARKIGDRLLEHHVAGSVNHGSIPAQLLGPLYRHTGDTRYIKSALRRVFKLAIPFQLPSGDWDGHEGRVWYQGVNLKTLVETYVSTPFTLEYSRRKDRLAQAIFRAANWFVRLQDESGAFPLTRGGSRAPVCEGEVVAFDGHRFTRKPLEIGYLGHGAYEVDGLTSVHEKLHAEAVIPVAHGYAGALARTDRLWRLEFNTLGAGRYLGFLGTLENVPECCRKGSQQFGSEPGAVGRAIACQAPTRSEWSAKHPSRRAVI
jgi:hypothetical protein